MRFSRSLNNKQCQSIKFLLGTSGLWLSTWAFSLNRSGRTLHASARCEQPPRQHTYYPSQRYGKYFELHGQIPRPAVMHAVLPEPSTADERRRGILVIGDVHGCLEELLELHEKAKEANAGRDFDHLILVGDLCNKGPQSAEVIRFVRQTERWWTVRGNHDDGALAALLGDVHRRGQSKYQWIFASDNQQAVLTDDDVEWLVELPYTLRIPGNYLGDQVDTVIVHAGLVPGLELEKQTIKSMVTLREVEECDSEDGSVPSCAPVSKGSTVSPIPWARVWTGPYRVVFGHDARRGLQLYPGGWAVGLDTGVVYGKKLTGMILPERKIVQVAAKRMYSPIGGSND